MSQLKTLLGKRIKEIRISKNLTQEELSELTNIGASSISKIESGYFHPNDENLEKIAKALQVEPYKLYMFEHIEEREKVLEKINTMLKNSNDEELKLAYKVLDSILN